MNAGCAEAQGELISLTDDDAVPRPDWLERIEQAFLADDRIGAVGGMDILRSGGDIPTSYTTNVGIVTWYGRVIGNHHAGTGPLREVDHLKGVNMSWRVTAAGRKPFATDLRGAGAQVFFEMSFCFRLAREGWKIVYDPAILVDHYVAVRFDEDARAARSVSAQENAAFNLYMSFLREHSRGWKRFAALAWARLIGFRGIPGLLRQLPAYLRNDSRGKEVAVATRRAWRDAHAVARTP
jgi:GT2 family glycosyltransferase